MWADEPVYIHRHSGLGDAAPEWVAYLELSEGATRVCMRGVTAVSPAWLPRLAPALCDRLQPLTEPPPRFDPRHDDVLCVVAPLFGPRSWPLPPQASAPAQRSRTWGR